MSRTIPPWRPAGTATAIGFVPIIGTRARVGAMSGEALVRLTPIIRFASARIAYQPAIP